MTMVHRMAFLTGLVGVPVLLLVLGHHLRRGGAKGKGRFWGGIMGYLAGAAIFLLAVFIPPTAWTEGGGFRFLVMHWGMLAGGLLGVFAGAVLRSPYNRNS